MGLEDADAAEAEELEESEKRYDHLEAAGTRALAKESAEGERFDAVLQPGPQLAHAQPQVDPLSLEGGDRRPGLGEVGEHPAEGSDQVIGPKLLQWDGLRFVWRRGAREAETSLLLQDPKPFGQLFVLLILEEALH